MQLFLLSSIKTSGRFFQIFEAFSEKLDFITSRGFYSSRLNGATCGSLEWPPSGAFQVERGKLYFSHQMVSKISNLRILFFLKNYCCYLHLLISKSTYEVTLKSPNLFKICSFRIRKTILMNSLLVHVILFISKLVPKHSCLVESLQLTFHYQPIYLFFFILLELVCYKKRQKKSQPKNWFEE